MSDTATLEEVTEVEEDLSISDKRASREPSAMHKDVAEYIKETTGYDADPKTVMLAYAVRVEYRKSDRYAELKRNMAKAKEEARAQRKAERDAAKAAAKAAKEAEEAAKAAEAESEGESTQEASEGVSPAGNSKARGKGKRGKGKGKVTPAPEPVVEDTDEDDPFDE